VHSVSLFGQTYSVRYHAPLTSNSPLLCSDAAKLKLRDVVGVNTGLTGFANSDFSNAVSGDVRGLAHGVQGLAAAGAACVHDTQACAQASARLAQYIGTHPREVRDALVQAQVRWRRRSK
jgi:hypothetical protein